jgi:ATP-dependent exoDNAse (exonuclease V) alpha subunit
MNPQEHYLEALTGIVERVTFHNSDNGWSVLRVSPFKEPHKLVTVVVHQARVVAGASMEFRGAWTNHPRFGEQFRAVEVIEKKPASAAALEKYLGSGLIKGVGPKIAQKIVRHFGERTLEVFESRIDELLDVPGIAGKKLQDIKSSWQQHQSIRDVMIFLQGYGISTLFAVKIYKTSGVEGLEHSSLASSTHADRSLDSTKLQININNGFAAVRGISPAGQPDPESQRDMAGTTLPRNSRARPFRANRNWKFPDRPDRAY